MQTFAYVALDPAGRRKSGVTEASTADAAIAAISAEGRFVVEIKASKPEASAGEKVGRRRASKADLALFTRRMADLAAAGLPLDRVLQVVAEQSESSELRRVAEGALVEVRGGMPVSEALAQHPRLFPQVYTQTLRAGEASGQFAQVAERLAQFQETEVERKSKIVSAMIYPGVLTVTAVGVVVFLVTFVIPKLVVVFKDLGGDLPLSTKMLLLFTDFVSAKGLFLLGGIVAATVFYRAWVATETGASARDALLLHSPMLGPVMTKATVSRFARVLGTLIFGGVPILDALHLAGLSAGNRVIATAGDRVAGEVREGRAVAVAMRDTGVFPPVLTHMVAIGEETGDLPKMLSRVSDSLDFEVDNGLRRLTAVFEPMIVLVMGGIVGFVVLSVLLPIFQAQELIK